MTVLFQHALPLAIQPAKFGTPVTGTVRVPKAGRLDRIIMSPTTVRYIVESIKQDDTELLAGEADSVSFSPMAFGVRIALHPFAASIPLTIRVRAERVPFRKPTFAWWNPRTRRTAVALLGPWFSDDGPDAPTPLRCCFLFSVPA